MVIQQAMAMGCAIITTDVPGPSEVVENGVSGVLVKAHSSEELAAAMEKLSDNVQLRSSLSAAALIRVRKLFNRSRMLELTYQDRLRMMNQK
jgi:glycosyltransferase involved in cell wall biosynthesis